MAQWTEAEIERLRATYPTGTIGELKADFGRAWDSINAKAFELGIGRIFKPRWMPEDLVVLRAVWPGATRAEVLASLPGRSWAAVSRKAIELKISRRTGKGRSREPRPYRVACSHCSICLDICAWSKGGLCPDCWLRARGIVVDWSKVQYGLWTEQEWRQHFITETSEEKGRDSGGYIHRCTVIGEGT